MVHVQVCHQVAKMYSCCVVFTLLLPGDLTLLCCQLSTCEEKQLKEREHLFSQLWTTRSLAKTHGMLLKDLNQGL